MRSNLGGALALFAAAVPAGAAERLPALGADLAQTSVSGLSAGAFMAAQFQVAFSSITVGAGIVAGGPYSCAETSWSRRGLPTFGWANLGRATGTCMSATAGTPDGAGLATRAAALAAAGTIDPIAAVRGDRVYLFHGEADSIVAQAPVTAAAAFYSQLGVPAADLHTVLSLPGGKAGHALVVVEDGSACGLNGPPFIDACGYDQAGEILAWIYPDIDRAAGPGPAAGERLVFDQTEFLPGAVRYGLAREGVVYIPRACRGGAGCRVHIALHGCLQSRTVEGFGDAFVERTGYLGWADANRLIILFPQTNADTAPNACWDWWGYAARDFLTREAPQLMALRAMVARLAEAP